ncbi:hypothetical protein PsorP6_014050 [Peronosclerospora sorghi]|uniref:Uncharacterized protein n=1 Tax=Peronosclerospora sorghi TaxID=230839 RepID=A0ACC0VHR0_9STRA|nr:hypothetical protein PsorP6_014050 [Peronosclerospora sorghi]
MSDLIAVSTAMTSSQDLVPEEESTFSAPEIYNNDVNHTGSDQNNSEASDDRNELESPLPGPYFGIDKQHFEDRVFATLDLAKEALDEWAKTYGFAVKGKKKYPLGKTGGWNQDFPCIRSGVYIKSTAAMEAPQSNVATNLTDCKWKAQIRRETSVESKWLVKLLHTDNNHQPTGNVAIYPLTRRIDDPEIAAFLNANLKAGTKAPELLRAVKRRYPTCTFRLSDIYNKITAYKKALLEGEDDIRSFPTRAPYDMRVAQRHETFWQTTKKDFPAEVSEVYPMLTWDQFEKRIFKLFLESATEEAFMQDWADIRSRINEEAADYIQCNWIEVHKERFCEPWLRDVHMGHRHTSRVESGHRSVKSRLGSTNQGLFAIYIKLRDHFEEQLEEAGFSDERQQGSQRTAVATVLAEVDCLLSNKASLLLHEQAEKAKIEYTKQKQKGDEYEPPECTQTFSRTYGLPCSHTLLEYIRQEDRIEADLLTYPFWFLDEKLIPQKHKAPFNPPKAKGKDARRRIDSAHESADKRIAASGGGPMKRKSCFVAIGGLEHD